VVAAAAEVRRGSSEGPVRTSNEDSNDETGAGVVVITTQYRQKSRRIEVLLT
jgi:hypothetical protein